MSLEDLEHKLLGLRAYSYLLSRSHKGVRFPNNQLECKEESILQAGAKLSGEGLHYLTARAVPEGHHHH